ncbi:hypothetical protein [Shimazuella alba]|uniref:Uncharacterized protein n=1 Tax=Shimazuella alba TaxID=2690964 RepID=A0A6I4VTH5_9BACL|nr:hypothetical protein [Shimazuella alba]MXQ53150.1 hypothetical protein [Shimazuella alba]
MVPRNRRREKFNPKEISSRDLQDYRSYCKPFAKPTTVNKKVAAFIIYGLSSETDRVQTDPMRKIKMKFISTLQLTPRWLTRREQSCLLDVLKEKTKIC